MPDRPVRDRMAAHKCPARPCDVQVPFRQLACRGHWFALPQRLRNMLNDAYHGPGLGSEAHDAALRDCLHWYAENT
jgi:hypothetical protein